jgi:AcrR family transcriptional regulator
MDLSFDWVSVARPLSTIVRCRYSTIDRAKVSRVTFDALRQQSAGERRRRSDGERSRRTILDAAARLATVEGIDGLSIGGLAKAIGMSKSGLYAHFGSKEELQLETIAAAQAVFDAEVVNPALEAGEGLTRVEALCERFLSHVERGVFPGGCFFASVTAELDTRPGPARDRIAAIQSSWAELISSGLREAQARRELDQDAGIEQLTFEINAMLAQANTVFVLYGDHAAFDLARHAIHDRLERVAPA